MGDYKFSGPRALDSPEVVEAFRATGNFHDAFLDEVEVNPDTMHFLVSDPYFVFGRKYSNEGLEGAKFSLSLRRPLKREENERIDGLSDQDVVHLVLDLETQSLLLSIMLSTMAFIDVVIEIDPRTSTFEWK